MMHMFLYQGDRTSDGLYEPSMPCVLGPNTMGRFHIGPVYMRMNGHFVHLKKFWMDKLTVQLDICQMTDVIIASGI